MGGAPAKLKDGAGDAVRTSSLFVPGPTVGGGVDRVACRPILLLEAAGAATAVVWEGLPERCPGGYSSPLAYSKVCYHPEDSEGSSIMLIMVAKVSSARTPTKWFCVQLFVRPSMCRQRCAIYLPMKPTFCWGQTNGREEERIGYRHCSIFEAQSLCCVVAWWHCGCGGPYQVCSDLLFELPLAVTSFNG